MRSGTTGLTDSLEQRLTFRAFQPGPGTRRARTPAFDEAIEQVIMFANEALDELEDYEKELARNTGLEPGEYRRRILNYLLQQKRDAYPGTAEIAIALAIPSDDMMDALEMLEKEGAINAVKSVGNSWRVELTAHGRNLAKGRVQESLPSHSAVVFNQQFTNSTIANAGINSGTINQHVTNFPVLPEDVREAASASDQVGVGERPGSASDLIRTGDGEGGGRLERQLGRWFAALSRCTRHRSLRQISDTYM